MPGLNASQEILDSKEYSTVSKYISGHHHDSKKVAEEFCEPVENKFMQTLNPSDAEGLLWKAWQAVVAVAASTPHTSEHRQKLVDFVDGLTTRVTLMKDTNICQIDDMTVWMDLPVLAWELRESWNLAATEHSDQKHKNHWVNLNAWTASMTTATHGNAQFRQDYSLFGIWSLRTALEESEKPADVALQAAAVWLIYSAPALHDYCKKNKQFDGKVAKPGSMFSNEEWRGFSAARWSAWEKRFNDLKSSSSDKTTKDLVEKALKAMKDADN